MTNSDAAAPGLDDLLNREKIRDCIVRLARGEDRPDAKLISASYWSDSTIDHGVFSGSSNEDLAWVVPGSPMIPVTQHSLAQSAIELESDTALVETYVTAYHRVAMADEDRDAVLGGRYLDRMEKRGDEWRIAQRTMLYDWYQIVGASVDWSQGLMGMSFSVDHYSGRAVGDYSESFFGVRTPGPSGDLS